MTPLQSSGPNIPIFILTIIHKLLILMKLTNSRNARSLLLISALLPILLWGCSSETPDASSAESSEQPGTKNPANTAEETAAGSAPADAIPERNAYFGDLHVHTRFSFDAFIMGTRSTPDDAYRFAKGAAIEHASGFMMQMKKPLDFLAVTDHGLYLGMMPELADPVSTYADQPIAETIRKATDVPGSRAAFAAVLRQLTSTRRSGENDPLRDKGVARNAWDEIIASAERHNAPGEFTTFIAYEYTKSADEFQNLHRNVVFRGSNVPTDVFPAYDSQPEDLWNWLDEERAKGNEGLAIPHNSNGSDGWMFAKAKWDGSALDADYAEQRMRNEPLVENTQVKGTSDTHPLLSPNDEWADFEIMPLRVASTLESKPQGSYVREAYLNGLVMQASQGFNPYKFGVIGSSDTHNAAGSFEEDNYWSKTGVLDSTPQLRGSVPLDKPGPNGEKYANFPAKYWGASGLAGVWAESNTRDAIYDAFRRKETFSTSGPHIKLRFFGSFTATGDDPSIAELYETAVPMGGDLPPLPSRVPPKAPSDPPSTTVQSPIFHAWAIRDNDSGALQRLQVIKGWTENGKPQEKVFDIACSDGLEVDPTTQRCPDNGARVNLNDCSVTADRGASELKTRWKDSEFNPEQHAFYYLRVLENPMCRWSTWDAIRAGVPPRPDMHATIQDRAWSSPIWYQP